VADPGFRDPESGDFSIDPGSPVAALGFVNFDMTSFGVVSPRLISIANVPLLPEVQMRTNTTGADDQPGEEILWKDARLMEPRGPALSAYGMGLGTEGVAFADVPRFSGAWAMGLRTGDFIVEVDGKKAGTMKKFVSMMEREMKHRIRLVRNQKEIEIIIK